MENTERKITAAVILAGGVGSRMQSDKTKQNIEILGKSVIERCVCSFEECGLIDRIIVVVREEELEKMKKLLSIFKKVTDIVTGASTRRESAKAGFCVVGGDVGLVAVHDAARCLVTPEMIEKVVSAASVYGAATAVSPIYDTLKLCKGGFIEKTLPREKIFAASTPQVFLVDLYKKALDITEQDSNITDDNMMLEKLGEKIFCVDVGTENIKITTKNDLDIAKFIIEKRMKNG